MMAELSLTERLAHHLTRPVGEEDRQRARLHLLDWLGCVLGARESELAAVVNAHSPNAIHVAAYLGNLLEMDDVHRSGRLHPGPVIWPAVFGAFNRDTALLLNEIEGLRAEIRALLTKRRTPKREPSLSKVLDSAIRGYEAMITIGATFDDAHYALYHPTCTAGMFGSSAVTAAYLALDTRAMASAFGNAGSVSGGLWQMRHSQNDTKQWHIWQAVVAGTDASEWAGAGLTGPSFILEGPQGLYAATCEAPKPMELTEHWRIHEVSFKPWAACRHAHPAIDAALELKRQGGLSGAVRVETYADALTFCDNPDPRTPQEAKFSLQHAVAVVAERGEPRLQDFEPDAIAALAEARQQVTVAKAPEFTRRYPEHFGARVSDGEGAVELTDTRGDPERPLSAEGVEAKARALMEWGGLSNTAADEVVAAALTGSDAGDVVDLLERHL